MRKASHCGNKQQQSSPDEITLLLLVRAMYTYCCSSCTSHSWWITQSTQRHQRGCNNTPSFLQRTALITCSLCEGWSRHDLHILVTAPFCCNWKSPSGMCAKLRTVAASNNRVHPTRSLYYWLFATRIHIVVLRAHPIRGETQSMQRHRSGCSNNIL